MVESLRSWPLTEAMKERLPVQAGAPVPEWSAMGEVLRRRSESPSEKLCYPQLLRDVRREIHARCQGQDDIAGIPPPPPEPPDIEGMVAAIRDASPPGAFDGVIAGPRSHRHKFKLDEVWALHSLHCSECKARGSFESAVMNGANESNHCYIKEILVILDGQWRLPLTKEPAPFERPAGNYPSFERAVHLCPETAGPLLTELKDSILVEVPEDAAPPTVVSPMLAVIKDQDLLAATRALEALGVQHKFDLRLFDTRAMDRHLKQLDALNAKIATVLAEDPAGAAAVGLKKVKVRVCTDLGHLNDVTADIPFSYFDVFDAVAMLEEGQVMAKVDLKNYFWAFAQALDDQQYLGVRLHGRLYVAQRAMFGGKLYPLVASVVMAELCRAAKVLGIPTVFYCDDVFLAGSDEAPRAPSSPSRLRSGAQVGPSCGERLSSLQDLFHLVGLELSPGKTVGPSPQLVFLGVEIDREARRLSLPRAKVPQLLAMVDHALREPHHPRKFIESLHGSLQWATPVILGAKIRLCRLTGCLAAHRGPRPLRLLAGAQEDLEWWRITLSELQDESSAPRGVPFWDSSLPIRARIYSDSSGDEVMGFGLAFGGRVYQGQWRHTGEQHSSAYRELVPILLAMMLSLSDSPRESVFLATTDSASVAFMINKGTCTREQSDCYPLLFHLFELARRHSVFLLADWVPREFNQFMDDISKGVV